MIQCGQRMRLVAAATSEKNILPRHVDNLTSLANPYVKHLVRVRESAPYRESSGSVLVPGSTLLRELCEYAVKNKRKSPFNIEVLILLETSNSAEDLKQHAKRIIYVTSTVMQKIAGFKSCEALDAVGVLSLPSSYIKLNLNENENSSYANATLQGWCSEPHRLLVLDGIQDPGNLGTLLRTATAFAWDGVYLLPGCCDPFNEKTLRASRGANFRIPIAAGAWNILEEYANANYIKLYAANPEQLIYDKETLLEDIRKENALCLVLGSEGQGLSDAVRSRCQRLSIPMPGIFESLNVAVVGGILMFMLMKKISQ